MNAQVWSDVGWPERHAGDALVLLARRAKLAPDTAAWGSLAALEVDSVDDDWMTAAAEALGIEAQPIVSRQAGVEEALASFAPALVRVVDVAGAHLLAVIGADGKDLVVVTPTHRLERVSRRAIADTLTRGVAGPAGPRIERWLDRARVSKRRRARAREELLRQAIGDHPIDGAWLLRAHPGSSFLAALGRSGALQRGAIFAVTALVQIALGIVSWVVLGRGALSGAVELSWLAGWGLVIASSVAAQIVASWSAGRLAIDLGGILKQRLLCGALRVDPREVRYRGAGALLSTVAESGTVETVGLAGALSAVTASLQLASAAFVLAAGAGGAVHVVLLFAWAAVIAACTVRAARRRATWTARRFALTNDYVEKVIGQRTRVAQQAPSAWHVGEDVALDAYLDASIGLDRAQLLVGALPARGWLLVGLLGLVPALAGGPGDPVALAIAIGGVLQAAAGFAALASSLSDALSAGVAWRSIAELFRAASHADAVALNPAVATRATREARAQTGPRGPVLEARGVDFSYEPHGARALRDCGLVLHDGDRVLLEGPSGGGKSTLVSLLTGLQTALSGVILLGGLDRPTLGALAWRQRIASAPQFHENHLFSGTLAFNLLMGRAWPASPADRSEAESICRELALAPLLERMPSGLDQIIGETGWQLSHGERSRVFLARAILQRADVVVLDETFGALDPITLRACMECVKRRARTLVVVAHP